MSFKKRLARFLFNISLEGVNIAFNKIFITLIFFLSSISIILPNDINIYFFKSATDSKKNNEIIESYITDINNSTPFNFFKENLKFFTIKLKDNPVYIDDFDRFNFNVSDISTIITKNSPTPSLSIFIIDSDIKKAVGGKIGDDIPVVFITSLYNKNALIHEIGHSLFNLGDEYGSDISINFTEKYVSAYKNLSIYNNVPFWEEIKTITKDKFINYYTGGLESKDGVYHSYPRCIMNDLSDYFCPICLYLSVEILNRMTNKNINFLYVYNSVNF